ncbi:MAG: hypothetical protein BGO63_18990 [Candidatus Accumulibacter sp. 66-26]|nr:MAG: hypothetical protein BGO63_18990 [Candidatus Accumulibacter sp. 66-26]
MTLRRLLDAPLLARLRERLRAALPDGADAAGAAETSDNGLLSITLPLDADLDACWQAADFTRSHVVGWAQPANGETRLALGYAMIFGTAGPARFAALQAAFAGIAPHWRHDDSARTGHTPAAHLGFAFDEEAHDGGAGELPNARLVVPAILLQARDGRCSATFSCAVRDADTAIERWQAELAAASRGRPRALPASPSNRARRRPTPLAERAFLARVRAALADIAGGRLAKVVLTRSTRIDAGHPIVPARLLAALAARHPECTIYGVGQHGRCFAGATPERLVALDAGVVRADALAGTAWHGDGTTQTAQARQATLQDDKNGREQQLVVDAVRAALAPLCVSLDAPQPPEVLQVRELQHLRTGIVGRVRTGVGLFDLIARLHPTPAVGGTPGADARRWLRAHRERRAAWYTGGIGWIDRAGAGEVAVALRCACIDGAQAELFAGAGIVAGSDPQQELAETEAKFGPLLAALDALDATGSPGIAAGLPQLSSSPQRRTGTP